MSSLRTTRFQHGKKMYLVTIRTEGDYYYFVESPRIIKDELKAMQGSKWLGFEKVNPEQAWRVNRCRRNDFAISYLEGHNPYARYKAPLVDKDGQGFRVRHKRKDAEGAEWDIRSYQIEMILHIMLRRQCIVAGEMGTGKTLAVFEAMELALTPFIWYVAPKSALNSVKLEQRKWKLLPNVRFMTYDELKGILKNWKAGDHPPTFLVGDESSRIKNATSQRSQAFDYLAEQMRLAYGDKCYIVEMSGSPAPKEPTDWYNQCEIACPGYLREGDLYKFKDRLAVQGSDSDVTGYSFKKVLAWRDGRAGICNLCAKPQTHECHDMTSPQDDDGLFGNRPSEKPHHFVPLTNEVATLYRRMAGLVLVKLKKDCLDLPEKQYRIIKLRPSLDLLRAARIVQSQSTTAVGQMTLLRELSDGFQYRDTTTLTGECSFCHGLTYRYAEGGVQEQCMMCVEGKKQETKREVIEVESPKTDALASLLDENDEVGRIVIYAGFTASIDRICKQVEKLGWKFLRIDGRGYNTSTGITDPLLMLEDFQNKNSPNEKVAVVAHPGSAGMGLTLTRASMIVYYSNDFNGESRIQSEDRIHRLGMDENRGATIVDLILLPTDLKVRENLRKKRELQSITLGELAKAIEDYNFEDAVVYS